MTLGKGLKRFLFVFVVVLALLFTIQGALAVPSGGVSYYNFSSLTDLWGSNHGTNSGATSITSYPTFNISGDSSPNSFNFDGTNDKITLPVSSGAGDETLSFWFNADTLSTSNRWIISDWSSPHSYLVVIQNAVLSLSTRNPDNTATLTVTTSGISTNTWYNVVYTRTSGSVQWYLNSVPVGSPQSSDNNGWRSTTVASTGTSDYFDGSVDEIQFFSRALNSSEVANLYNYGSVEGASSSSVSNFSVTAKDTWDNTNIDNFSVSINGTNYTTTSGSVTTGLLRNDTNLYDVFIYDAVNSQGGFFNRTYEDTNISSNLDGILSQTDISFLAYEKITDALIQGNVPIQINNDSYYNDGSSKFYNYTISTNSTLEVSELFGGTSNVSIDDLGCSYNPLQLQLVIGSNKLSCNGGSTTYTVSSWKVYSNLLYNISIDGQITNNTNIPITAGTYNVTFIGFDDYYNKTAEFTIPALSTSTYNITGIYDALLSVYMNHSFDNSSITPSSGYVTQSDLDFNESFSGTTPNEIGLIQGYNYTVTPTVENYTQGSNYSDIVYVNSTTEAITLYLYKFNSILFSFLDELTNLLIDDRTVTIDVIGDTYATNTSTTNGTLYLTLLDPNSYIFRYDAENYTERQGYLALNNNTASQLSLYLLPEASASNFTVEVIDQNGNPVQDAQVKASRYYIDSNSYILQETGTTNFEGKTTLSLQLNSEYYKFYVELNGELLRILPGESTSTTPSILTSTSITLRVLTADDLFDNEFAYLNYNGDVVYNEDTQNFRFDWSDSSSVSTNNCLYVYAVNVRSRTLYNSSCSTSTTGSILISIANDTYDYFVAEAYFTDTSDNDWLVDSAAHSYEEAKDYFNASGTGLILQILLSLLFVGFVAATEVRAVTIMLPVSLIVGKLIGFTLFGWPALLAFTALGFIFLFMLTRNQ